MQHSVWEYAETKCMQHKDLLTISYGQPKGKNTGYRAHTMLEMSNTLIESLSGQSTKSLDGERWWEKGDGYTKKTWIKALIA